MASQNAKKPGSTSPRGFASMNAGQRRAVASKGGQSVPKEKRSFSQNRNLAAEAGRKGGKTFPTRAAASHGTAILSPRRGGKADALVMASLPNPSHSLQREGLGLDAA